MRALLTLVSLGFIALFALGVVAQLHTWRRLRAVRPWMIVISQGAAFLSMLVFSVLTARPPGPVAWVLLLGLGGAAGLVYGSFVRVVRTPKGVQMSYTLPWIVTWSVLMVLTQLNAVLARQVPVVLYGFAILNLGLNLGMYARVLGAYSRAAAVAAGLLAAGLGWTSGPVRAQTEEQAVVDAVLFDGNSDPVLRQCRRAMPDLRILPPRERGSGAGATVYGQQLYTAQLYTPVWLRVLAFGDPSAAERYARSGIDSRLHPLRQSSPKCRRLVGGRYVIELTGHHCIRTDELAETHDRRRAVILDAVEAQALRVVGRRGTTTRSTRSADERPVQETDDREKRPLTPAESTAAVALSSLVLAGGSLLQLLPTLLGSRPIGAASPLPPPLPADTALAPPPVTVVTPSPEGVTLVTASPPPPIDPAEARAREMEARGYRWSDRDGWVTGEQAREYQAQRDRAWEEHLKQDAEAARLVDEIGKAREGQEAARARQAEYDRHVEMIDRQQELERQQAAAREELAQQDWMGRAVDVVQMAADTAIGEIAEVTGPVGQAIRAGYNATKGMATVVGEAIAEGRGLRPADIRRGIWLGVENVVEDMGLDALGGKLRGDPRVLDEAAEHTAQAASRAEKAARDAATEARLEAGASEIRRMLDSQDPEAVLRLYEDHGMKKLAEMERAGKISPKDAVRLNATLSEAVDRAVDRGTREATDLWEKGNPGVRLKEVLVGDSGSSALRGKPRSVLTDFDRTTVPVFEPEDVRQYAANRGITPAQAHQELTQQFKSIHEKAVGDALPGRLGVEDVDYKSYGGFGSKAGQADAYPSGFATTRQAVQGKTTVYPPGGGRPHVASREAIVDQWDMEIASHGGPAPAELGPRIAPQEFPGIAHEQVKAIAEKGDPKSVAKALDRVAYMTQRSEVRVTGHTVDEGLMRLAAEVKRNPQGVPDILGRAGVSEAEFAERALAEAQRFEKTVAGWNRPPGGG